jgi:hypothetical protein
MNQKRQGLALLLLGLVALTGCAKPASSSTPSNGNTSNDTSLSSSKSTSTSNSASTSNSTAASESTSTSTSSSKEDEYVVALFLDYDGALLNEQRILKGTTPVYEGPTPSRNSDTHYNYTWTGWDKAFAPISENTTYTAVYEQDQFAYDVRFVDHDGSLIQTVVVNKGLTVAGTISAGAVKQPLHEHYVDGETGVYFFDGWKVEDLEAVINADTTITATYTLASSEVAVFFSFPNDVVLEEYIGAINSTYTLPTPRATVDEKFVAWYADKNYTVLANTTLKMTKNVTLYAKCTALTTGSELYYQIVGDHAEVVGIKTYQEKIEVLPTYENKPVTVIKKDALGPTMNVISIVIPESVTTIENGAIFHDQDLSVVSLPNSAATIGKDNFLDCPKLAYFYVGEDNLDYETRDGITLIDHNTLTIIASATYGLSNYEIPEGLKAIGDYAFKGSKLKTVEAPNSLVTIGEGAFYNSTLERFDVFAGKGLLPGVSRDSLLTSIGKLAFCSTRLDSFMLGAKVTEVGPGAFAGMTPLENIFIEHGNTTFTWANDCLYKTATGELVAIAQGTMTIPVAITSIAPYTFYRIRSNPLTIRGAITSIGEHAFEGTFYSDQDLVFSNTSALTTIGDYAFKDVKGLSTFKISATVTSIGKGAFLGCDSLTTFTVDSANTVYTVVANRFLAHLPTPTMPALTIIAFAQAGVGTTLALLMAPVVLADDFFGHNGETHITTVSAALFSLNDTIFSNTYGITTINLSGSVFPTLVSHAFNHCDSLLTITLPATITSIESEAFYNCVNLQTLNFPGTKAQWGQVQLAADWNKYTGLTKITCSDGEVEITPSYPL